MKTTSQPETVHVQPVDASSEPIRSLVVTCPFPITQTDGNKFQIDLTRLGIKMPELLVQGQVAAEFCQQVRISEDAHDAIIERMQDEYAQRLIVATFQARWSR